MATQNGNCPACGQRLLTRHGVELSPRLADLFDMIERSEGRGVMPEVLADVFYPGKPSTAGRRCVAVNIHFLNSRLLETDLQVRAGSGTQGPYRLIVRSKTR